MHCHVGKNGGEAVVGEGETVYVQRFVCKIRTVFHGSYGRGLGQQIQHPVAGGEGLGQIARQGRNSNDGSKGAEHGHHAHHHTPGREAARSHQRNANGQRGENKEGNGKLGGGSGGGGIVFHLFGFQQQCVGAAVDLLLAAFARVVEHNVLDALDAVKEVGVEGGELRPVPHA